MRVRRRAAAARGGAGPVGGRGERAAGVGLAARVRRAARCRAAGGGRGAGAAARHAPGAAPARRLHAHRHHPAARHHRPRRQGTLALPSSAHTPHHTEQSLWAIYFCVSFLRTPRPLLLHFYTPIVCIYELQVSFPQRKLISPSRKTSLNAFTTLHCKKFD